MEFDSPNPNRKGSDYTSMAKNTSFDRKLKRGTVFDKKRLHYFAPLHPTPKQNKAETLRQTGSLRLSRVIILLDKTDSLRCEARLPAYRFDEIRAFHKVRVQFRGLNAFPDTTVCTLQSMQIPRLSASVFFQALFLLPHPKDKVFEFLHNYPVRQILIVTQYN